MFIFFTCAKLFTFFFLLTRKSTKYELNLRVEKTGETSLSRKNTENELRMNES